MHYYYYYYSRDETVVRNYKLINFLHTTDYKLYVQYEINIWILYIHTRDLPSDFMNSIWFPREQWKEMQVNNKILLLSLRK